MESKTAEVEGRSAPTGSVPIGLVGRDRELRLLQSALESAGSGSGGVALLSGEPGIGKTRLADVLADHARANGAVVLWGRTWEAGGAPSYWPWTMALRSHLRSVGPVDFVDVGPGAAALVDVVPELAAALPPTTSSPAADPATARFELFEAVTGVLRALADDRPLLIVLDDVHAADTPSLLLLQYLAGQLERKPDTACRRLPRRGARPHAPAARSLGGRRAQPEHHPGAAYRAGRYERRRHHPRCHR